jgi:hypothetical protein
MGKYKVGEKELRLINQDELTWEHVKYIAGIILELKLELEKIGVNLYDNTKMPDVILYALSSPIGDKMIASVLTENGAFDKNLINYILQNLGKVNPKETKEILDYFFGFIPRFMEMLT